MNKYNIGDYVIIISVDSPQDNGRIINISSVENDTYRTSVDDADKLFFGYYYEEEIWPVTKLNQILWGR